MKKTIFSTLFYIAFFYANSQQITNKELQQVKVKDWMNNMSFFVFESGWKQGEDTLRKQITESHFQKIKFFSDHANMPAALLMWHPVKQPKKISLEEYEKRLSALKVFKVAAFSNQVREKRFDYVIVAAPCQELYWDKTAKWDTVYFIVRSEAIKYN